MRKRNRIDRRSAIIERLFSGHGEEGGAWFVKLPNTTAGRAPAAGSPTHATNIHVGNQFALGDYTMGNESWELRKIDHPIDSGPDDGWSAASYAGDRLMNMGWAPRGRTPGGTGRAGNQNDQLTIMREVRWEPALQTLVANPIAELEALRNGTVAHLTGVQLTAGAPFHLPGTAGGAAASADINVSFTLPASGAVEMVGVTVLSGAAPWGRGSPDDAGVDVVANVSAPDSTGRRHGNMTTARRHGACEYKNCCPHGNDHNCTERTFDNCNGALGPCDGAGAPDKTPCRHGHPGGNCGAASFVVLPGETELNFRILVDRAIVEAFVQGGRAVTTMTFRPLDQGVPGTQVNLVSQTPITAKVASVWSMGCGWAGDWPGRHS